jgi:hypothetical protein
LRGGGEVEEDNGRDNSATTGKKKGKMLLTLASILNPTCYPQKEQTVLRCQIISQNIKILLIVIATL